MDRYFTIMVVPEREKGVKSFRIPRVVFHAALFFIVIFVVLLGILTYDYWKILRQVYENKHLTIENRQLKEQVQLFQMKLNTLTEDLERIHTFEKKLRIITGIEEADLTQSIKGLSTEDEYPLNETDEQDPEIPKKEEEKKKDKQTKIFENLDQLKTFTEAPEYQNLQDLYEKKIATIFGLQTSYSYTKEWGELTKQSFSLASDFAEFDYKFSTVKGFVQNLEVNIHKLDQFLLDKDSFLRSTPTLLPTKGWLTSYYGPRISPTSKRLRMHEGVDIGARSGTPIVAAADGRITFAGKKPGFGNFVQIDHGYGVETFYAHAKGLFTKKGQVVKRGDLIASIGNTGASTGPHLHYEIRVNGTPVDPLYFVLD
ncbi:MAG: M23 family metallopeptidase [Bacteriovoracaceae bacterium]|nr:M23 family metallopeptidase [Bacteriovoracaceae bacterium]